MAGSTFGDRLRELRRERGMQQRELGELYNLSSSAIGSYERNLREPTLELLLQLSEYFGVSVDYLLCRTVGLCHGRDDGYLLYCDEDVRGCLYRI